LLIGLFIYFFRRILKALIITALLAKPSLILSYLIQKNHIQKSSKTIIVLLFIFSGPGFVT